MLLGAALTICALAPAAKDAVIMTVNGEDVPQSEFEYLYNKNSEQQLSAQPIDEYLEMFKLYKLKVAEARAQGLDTVAAFRKEMEQYRHDLALPYLTDSTYINSLFDRQIERLAEEVEAQHIMLFKTRIGADNVRSRAKADSILRELRQGASFEEMAEKYSGDRASSSRGGKMGYISAMQYPYNFETAAYTLGEGEISGVVESPMGYHILKGGKHRKTRGEVLAEHILIMNDREAQGENPRRIADSLYQVIKVNPGIFEAVAATNSDDKGSGRNGGKLDWFGAGQMVPEFDSVAFALSKGEISKPFRTRYGWHIIKKLDHRDMPPKASLKPGFLRMVSQVQDPRSLMIRNHQSEGLAKRHKGKFNNDVLKKMQADAAEGIDTAFYQKWSASPLGETQIYTVEGTPVSVGSWLGAMAWFPVPAGGPEYLEEASTRSYNEALRSAEEAGLLKTNPDYANLYKEYVDGSLLYEVSVKNVWDVAAKDEEGLQKYFEDNRSKYVFTEPKAKGYLVMASNDSIADAVKKAAVNLPEDSLVNTLRKEFKKGISIRKVLEGKGGNPMVDKLLFDGDDYTIGDSKFKTFFMLNPRVITEPETLSDVRGSVVADYQNKLQKEWEETLKKKYEVKVNDQVFRKVKGRKH